ncbi:MAG: 3-hydroxyacyl-ACP dehydratase [Caldimonas sp.]
MPSPPIRRIDIARDHPAFAGHFPGRPLLPGVALVAEVLEAAAAEPELKAALGASPQMSVVKFLAPVLPGTVLEIAFQVGARSTSFSVSEGGRIVASGQFARADLAAGVSP